MKNNYQTFFCRRQNKVTTFETVVRMQCSFIISPLQTTNKINTLLSIDVEQYYCYSFLFADCAVVSNEWISKSIAGRMTELYFFSSVVRDVSSAQQCIWKADIWLSSWHRLRRPLDPLCKGRQLEIICSWHKTIRTWVCSWESWPRDSWHRWPRWLHPAPAAVSCGRLWLAETPPPTPPAAASAASCGCWPSRPGGGIDWGSIQVKGASHPLPQGVSKFLEN